MIEHLTTRYDLSNAGWELGIILAVAFILGFLFCYFQSNVDGE
ncbi:hypothetical protein [Thiofilum flexile]|nr:hypothetical protein [Thiofilum flexile]